MNPKQSAAPRQTALNLEALIMQGSVLFRPNIRRLLLFLAPGTLLYGFIVLVPLVGAVIYSLYSDLNFRLKFVGLENYAELIVDIDFWQSFQRNLIIIGFSLVFQIGLAFAIAVIMNSRQLWWPRFTRSVLFLPVVLSPIVVAFLWLLIYNKDLGLVNVILNSLGLEHLTRSWLDDPQLVIYAITIPLIWQYTGLYMVIFLAGFSSIPQEILEQSEIDGASTMQKTRYVTLPLMADTWKVVLVLAIAGGVKIFEHPYAMTRGGPGLSSTVLAQYAYNQSFVRAKLTYGTTVAVGMVVISLALVALSSFLLDKMLRPRQGNP